MPDMNRSSARQLVPTAALLRFLFILSLAALLPLVGCTAHADPAAEAPPPANIVPGADPALFTVDHPEQFPLETAVERPSTSELVVTGTVTPDIARNVPVVSLASGRVVAIHARLGDTVQKGQLLLTIRSDDVAGGFDAYRKAVADELLARKQLNRAADMFAHGAIAEQDLEVAQDTAEDDQNHARDCDRASSPPRQRSRQTHGLGGHRCAHFGSDYRSGSDECGAGAGLFITQPVHDF
jgi:multidrug efflux pump subunit AcrA (membrane-fusion protein)